MHFGAGRPRTFNNQLPNSTWLLNVLKRSTTPKHNMTKDQITFLITTPIFLPLVRTLSISSSSCVSHDFLLEHHTRMVDILEHSMSSKLFALAHTQQLLFEISTVP